MRETIRLGRGWPLPGHDVEDLRDDVTGALDDHSVALADVPSLADQLAGIPNAADVVLVVQRGVGDDDAADGDRLQPRHRRHGARAADLDLDLLQHGGRLLGRELVRRRPARRARAEAEALLQVEPVDLVDDAVDVVGQRRPHRFDRPVVAEHLVERCAADHQLVDDESPVGQPPHRVELRPGDRRAGLAPGIGEELQRPRARHLRVLLAQTPRRRIARIGEGLPGLCRAPVEREEIVAAHVDLAAHLDQVRRVGGQPFGHLVEGADIGGDVLARHAVAARRRRREPALLVAQRHRQSVDLRLGGEDEFRIGGQRQEPPHRGDEVDDVLVGEDVVERQHRPGVLDRSEGRRRRRADATRRRILTYQRRETRLDGGVAQTQRIVFGVRDDRLVLGMVEPVVLGDLGGEAFEFRRGLFGGELVDGLFGDGHAVVPDWTDRSSAGRRPCGPGIKGC